MQRLYLYILMILKIVSSIYPYHYKLSTYLYLEKNMEGFEEFSD